MEFGTRYSNLQSLADGRVNGSSTTHTDRNVGRNQRDDRNSCAYVERVRVGFGTNRLTVDGSPSQMLSLTLDVGRSVVRSGPATVLLVPSTIAGYGRAVAALLVSRWIQGTSIRSIVTRYHDVWV